MMSGRRYPLARRAR